jgi:hypothetical protein
MLPNVASIANYDAPKDDYSPPRDPTVDRTAAGTNPQAADTAAMTHTALRAWVRFEPQGDGTPTLVSFDAMWNNGNNAAPVVAWVGGGEWTITFPATVFDEIPATAKGATPGGFAVNFHAAWCNEEIGSTTAYKAYATITAPNVITVKVYTIQSSPALTNPTDGTLIGVFAV